MSRSVLSWLRNRFGIPSNSQRLRPREQSPRISLEVLESRNLLATGLHPQFVLLPHGGAAPFGSPGPTGTTPAQIRHAYGFDQITFSGGTVAGDGSGTTIAIVDAFDDPNIANDLKQFDLRFGLPDPTFTKVNQTGGSTPPTANAGWASEIALDVEWAHAIAPKANILLVEATDNSYANLFAAVRYAASQPGVVVVSMSFGGGEFSGETTFDSTFLTPAGHAGVTFVASSGDSGAPASYPSASPNVLSVGGTRLNLDAAGNILSETAWSGSGGGLSAVENQPSYQNGVVTQSSTKRGTPDVAYDSDPNTGFPVYDSYNNGSVTPWSQFGGTSDASPQWAALIAIADQGRALAGLSSLDGRTETLPMLYKLAASDFHDITTGSSSGSPVLSAGTGYDLVTGRGSPFANLVVGDLVGQTTPVGATHYSVTTSSTAIAGNVLSVTVTARAVDGSTLTTYAGTTHFTSSDGAAVLPSNYTFVAGDLGTHTFDVTLKTAGSDTITATDTVTSSINGSANVTVSAAAASQLAFGVQPSAVAAGATISPAVTVRVLDAYGNLETGDNSDQVTVALASNAAGGVLGGTKTVTVSGGVATFSTLSVSKPGVGYTLTANSGQLVPATSASFNVGNSSQIIEDFESASTWNVVGGRSTAFRSEKATHDGRIGLDDTNGSDWIYRNDSAAQVKAGDTVSVWLKFANGADGRAYFGFGASASGTLSLVAAPNTGQLQLQQNLGYGFATIGAVSQSYQANHWYRLEVNWGTSGAIVGKLYDSDGTTTLGTVTANTTAITSGGIAFRAIGSDKYWDTVTATYGVNKFTRRTPTSPAPAGRSNDFGANFGGSASKNDAATPPSSSTHRGGSDTWALDYYFAARWASEWNANSNGHSPTFDWWGKSFGR